jgi:hypothetical protein
VFLTSF